jgi:hypothetical protein
MRSTWTTNIVLILQVMGFIWQCLISKNAVNYKSCLDFAGDGLYLAMLNKQKCAQLEPKIVSFFLLSSSPLTQFLSLSKCCIFCLVGLGAFSGGCHPSWGSNCC